MNKEGSIKKIKTIDMHTGGEPLRVVIDGYPPILGNSVLEKRRYCKNSLDEYRQFLMFEPRGHTDMYGCILVEPNDDEADFGVIFMHNEGYSTMCGHATIAIARLSVEKGWVKEQPDGETRVLIDAPCGRLEAFVNKDGSVRFRNVPSFVWKTDLKTNIDGFSDITFDIAYGGAFYAYLNANQLGLKVIPSETSRFIELGRLLKQRIQENYDISHPFEKDLGFLYGCIFIDEDSRVDVHSRNICVFADGEVDRSPTGSGVSGRAALHWHYGDWKMNNNYTISSVINTLFRVKIVDTIDYGPFKAIIPEVSGNAYITGYHEFVMEDDDKVEPFKL